MSNACACREWTENIDKVNRPFELVQARNPHLPGYDGVPIRYCPWCGELLIQVGAEIGGLRP